MSLDLNNCIHHGSSIRATSSAWVGLQLPGPTLNQRDATGSFRYVVDDGTILMLQHLDNATATNILSPTWQLLAEGGDARTALDAIERTNSYGCATTPDRSIAAFGSATASTISEAAFAAADRLRQHLSESIANGARPTDVCAYHLRRAATDLIQLSGVSEIPGLEVVLSPSGTDLHALVAQWLHAGARLRPLVVMIQASETGRGVPIALAGPQQAHDANSETSIEVVEVPVREADGTQKSFHEIDADAERLVDRAAIDHRRIMIVLVDGSKTGIVAPSPTCALALRRRWPGLVEVLVDACQFRLSSRALRAYLDAGCLVAITGSKFFSGPAFSGALFVPPDTSFAGNVKHYTSNANADAFPNFGLLLRWEAALEEMRAFRSLSESLIDRFVVQFTRAVESRFHADAAFELLATPKPDRGGLVATHAWDERPTIFPFLLYEASGTGRRPLDREQTKRVHEALRARLPQHAGRPDCDGGTLSPLAPSSGRPSSWQLGQPVPHGHRQGIPVSALRLCLGSRLIAEAIRGDAADVVIDRAIATLDRTAELIPVVCRAHP